MNKERKKEAFIKKKNTQTYKNFPGFWYPKQYNASIVMVKILILIIDLQCKELPFTEWLVYAQCLK